MLVGIIYLGQIELCPFVDKYIKVLDKEGTPYEIIHWDRSGEPRAEDAPNVHTFTMARKRYANPVLKGWSLFKFRQFAVKILKEKKYDKLVVLTTITGMLLYPMLTRHYRRKFVLDYRDASFERFSLFQTLLSKLVEASNFTSISSLGFLNILPESGKYVVTHNFKYDDVASRNRTLTKKTSGPIHISYIGVLREAQYLKRLIDTFGNDFRFDLYIHGGGDDKDMLERYAQQFQNVVVTGPYQESEKRRLIENADILCYNYPCSFLNDNALANKFYDSIIFKRPLFANIDTYSGMLVEQHGLGIALHDGANQVADRIYTYYKTFDQDAFCQSAERVLKEAVQTDMEYLETLEQFLEESR